MMDMTIRLVTPQPIQDYVRLETGMVFAQRIPANLMREEVHKLVTLVRPVTLNKPESPFDPANHNRVNVPGWLMIRLKTQKPHHAPGLQGGTLFEYPESALRRSWKYVGILGQIRGPIDWETV